MVEQWTVGNQADTESHIYKAGYDRGVAETEAKYAPWEHLVGENNDLRRKLDYERANGAALAAAAQIAQERLMQMSHRSLLSSIERVNGHAAAAHLQDALATHNASQGPEESHAE